MLEPDRVSEGSDPSAPEPAAPRAAHDETGRQDLPEPAARAGARVGAAPQKRAKGATTSWGRCRAAYLAGWRDRPLREGATVVEMRVYGRGREARSMAAALGLWYPGCGRRWTVEQREALAAAGVRGMHQRGDGRDPSMLPPSGVPAHVLRSLPE